MKWVVEPGLKTKSVSLLACKTRPWCLPSRNFLRSPLPDNIAVQEVLICWTQIGPWSFNNWGVASATTCERSENDLFLSEPFGAVWMFHRRIKWVLSQNLTRLCDILRKALTWEIRNLILILTLSFTCCVTTGNSLRVHFLFHKIGIIIHPCISP